MDKVYQVFVSSTFADLQDERRQVSDTLAKAGFIPAGMELFPATDQQQLEFIQRVIDRSDYYVVIVAGRYGSLDGNKSYTEKEYEYALERRIPVLAFIHREPGKIAAEKVDTDPKQIERLEAFRSRLKTSRIVDHWSDVHELRTEVLTAVMQAVNLSPRSGWVRGDQAIDPKILQEAERLRIENAELKKQLDAESDAPVSFPSDLLGPDDRIELKVSWELRDDMGRKASKDEGTVALSYKDVYVGIFDFILTEPNEGQLNLEIAQLAAKHLVTPEPKQRVAASISREQVNDLRYQFSALGLIHLSGGETIHERYRNRYITWSVTPKGQRFINQIRARRRIG